MKTIEYIQKLLAIPSPTDFTKNVAAQLCAWLKDMGYQPKVTRKGLVWCDLCQGEGEGLLLSAHVDTLGAMVRSVKGNGRIRYTKVASGADTTVETENVLIHTRDGRTYTGTVQSCHASQHVFPRMAGEERNDETLEIVLDELVHSAKDVENLGIETGCFISWDPRTVVTEAGFVKSRFLDDKASAGILLKIAEEIASGELKPSRPVSIMFTVHEEIGHGASMKLPENIGDLIAVDMGCVGNDLKCDETMVSICVKDSGGAYNYDLVSDLIAIAKENELRYAADVYPSYGSDAGASLRSGNDVRHACIGPGVFASHGYERTHLLGIENTEMLLKKYMVK